MNFPGFGKRKSSQSVQNFPRPHKPRPKGCEIKIEKTAHGMKLRKSPECKPEDVQAFVRAFKEENGIDLKEE